MRYEQQCNHIIDMFFLILFYSYFIFIFLLCISFLEQIYLCMFCSSYRYIFDPHHDYTYKVAGAHMELELVSNRMDLSHKLEVPLIACTIGVDKKKTKQKKKEETNV